jgi:hypothetical protein
MLDGMNGESHYRQHDPDDLGPLQMKCCHTCTSARVLITKALNCCRANARLKLGTA